MLSVYMHHPSIKYDNILTTQSENNLVLSNVNYYHNRVDRAEICKDSVHLFRKSSSVVAGQQVNS